jgi:hypothetical protein
MLSPERSDPSANPRESTGTALADQADSGMIGENYNYGGRKAFTTGERFVLGS